MFNLLPNSERAAVRSEYARRKLILGLLLLLSVILTAFVFMVPAYALSYFKLREVSRAAEELKTSVAVKSQEDLSAAISAINQKMSSLSLDTKKVAADTIEGALRHKTKDIRLRDIAYNYSTGKDGKESVTLKGIAKDRATLQAFVSDLKSDSAYERVDIPISNYAQVSDIAFEVQIIMKQ